MRELGLGALALGGVGTGIYYNIDSGTIYNSPIEQVATDLEEMEIPGDLKISSGMDISTQRDGNTIKWSFSAEGTELAVFTAQLTEEGPNQTRVKVGFQLGDSATGDALKKTPLAMTFAQSIAKIALAEQIDATLGKHPYDQKKVANAMIGYAITHPGEVAMFQGAISRFQHHADPEAVAELQEALQKDFPDMASRDSSEWNVDRRLESGSMVDTKPDQVLDADQQARVGQLRAEGISLESAESTARD